MELKYAMPCPPELRKECCTDGIVKLCRKCTVCKLGAYRICTHCDVLMKEKHKQEFDVIDNVYYVKEGL